MAFTTSKLFSTFLLLDIFISLSMHSTSAARNPLPKTNTDFIKTSCTVTSYPKLCFTSLSAHANAIQASPQLLAGTALNVTLSSAKSTSNLMVLLSRSQGINPREVAAMKDCIEELSDSVDELGKSINEMGQLKGTNFNLVINDIQTWVSAALTDESTCTDGFAGKSMNGNLKITVKDRIVNVAQLTSNALALINKFALIHG
ncbi:21 kDa protein [Ziziphus jujuba]|uniref:21 kDa protein n=2 Tax=Ziziphus jujuba TaxID=326968 RepID=A0A6P3ZRC1_ZIZJJ|nr:21 kDa protein [Ziziphus jujuba]KAH7537884.1 hypothetical protein FEM48_Zijuj03G0140400 [Ziziphus jujuba var. spinosa]